MLTNNKYLYIYAFCFITKGKSLFSIYDSVRHTIHQFDIWLYDIANYHLRNKTINKLMLDYNIEEQKYISEFVNYITENDLGRFVDDISLFPLLKEEWDKPYKVKKAIIDIKNIWHNLDAIFTDLTELLCPKIEIRFYRSVSIEELNILMSVFSKHNFAALYILLPLENNNTKEYIEGLLSIVERDYRVYFNIYGVTDHVKTSVYELQQEILPLSNNLVCSTKLIYGCEDCGNINFEHLPEMSIEDVIENKLYNGCLNRVMSVDEDGNIKNCPSMRNHYGNIKDTSLLEVYYQKEFQKYWYISNSHIEGCQFCNLRVVCKGCRAYIEDPTNIYSKPQKCTYKEK